jgi:hypothetical protein
MSNGRQAGGQRWVGHSNCSKHITTEDTHCKTCRINELETRLKAVQECERYTPQRELHSGKYIKMALSADKTGDHLWLRLSDVLEALETK